MPDAMPLSNAPPLLRYQAVRSWIAHGSEAILFATDDGELIRVALDREMVTLLRERIPEGWWPR